jgi:hypothetical protein
MPHEAVVLIDRNQKDIVVDQARAGECAAPLFELLTHIHPLIDSVIDNQPVLLSNEAGHYLVHGLALQEISWIATPKRKLVYVSETLGQIDNADGSHMETPHQANFILLSVPLSAI